jgi:ABC-type phosphate transport system auxiliary subunit
MFGGIIMDIIVSTGEVPIKYKIIAPVYFKVSNRGVFSSELSKLIKKYNIELGKLRSEGHLSKERMDWGFFYGEWDVGSNDFDKAFFISVQELKERAKILNADAIIFMRQDIDIDSNNVGHFYMQMYGTAVKFIK